MECVQPALMPTPLPLFLQLSATFSAVSSRILFFQVSAPTFFCLSSCRSHSCSLQQSGRCPLSPPSSCPPQTQTQFSFQDTHVKDGWIFFPSNWNFCLNFIHLKNVSWSAYVPHRQNWAPHCSSLMFKPLHCRFSPTLFLYAFSGAVAFPRTVSSSSLPKCCAKSVNYTLNHHFQSVLTAKQILSVLLLPILWPCWVPPPSLHILPKRFCKDNSAKTAQPSSSCWPRHLCSLRFPTALPVPTQSTWALSLSFETLYISLLITPPWAITDFSLLTMTAFITQSLNFETSIFSFSRHTCQKLSVNTFNVMFRDFWNSTLTSCLQKTQTNTWQFLSEALTVRLHILLTCAGTFLISSAGVVPSLCFM